MTHLVLVTGVSGSGKSALARYLTARGERAFSLDAHPGLCRWQDELGRPAVRPDHPDLGWLRSHTWAWQPDVLDELVAAQRDAGHDRVIFCGSAGNQRQHFDLFDLVLMLDIDAELMLARLNGVDRGTDFGRVGASRQWLIDRFQQDRAAMYATVDHSIDAAAPVEVVGNMVCALAALHQFEPSHV